MQSPQILDSILQSVPYGIIAIGKAGEVLLSNQLARAYLGLPEGAGFSLLPFTEALPDLEFQTKRALSKKKQISFDLLAQPVAGFYLTIRCRPIPEGYALSLIDVTRQKQMEQNMLDAILEAQEAQRRKLSTEIHDGIGPLISTVKLNFDALRSELQDASPRALQMIESISELLKAMSNDIRSISHNLMPNVLVDFGLAAALDNLCQRVNSSGKVAVHFIQSGMKDRIGLKAALGLYRIAQELVNNAVKYARATTINLQLIKHPDSIVLMVEDDGIGFSPKEQEAKKDKGIGLQNIQTRARSLGGTFLLDTQAGKGVVATIEIPIKNKKL